MTACKMHGSTEGQQPSYSGMSNLQIELHTADQPSDSFQPTSLFLPVQPGCARSAPNWIKALDARWPSIPRTMLGLSTTGQAAGWPSVQGVRHLVLCSSGLALLRQSSLLNIHLCPALCSPALAWLRQAGLHVGHQH